MRVDAESSLVLKGADLNSPDPDQLEIEFDPTIHSLIAAKKAAYRFGGRAFVEIAEREGRMVVIFKSRDHQRLHPSMADEFRNELLDQDLREILARETESVRNLLLAQAFSATSLTDPVGDEVDYQNDPLRIRDR